MLVKRVYAADSSSPPTFSDLEPQIQNLIGGLLGFAGILLFIILVIGGLQFLTSGGNPESAAKARKTITYGILGLVVVASAYLILVIIEALTGANVTNFSIFTS